MLYWHTYHIFDKFCFLLASFVLIIIFKIIMWWCFVVKCVFNHLFTTDFFVSNTSNSRLIIDLRFGALKESNSLKIMVTLTYQRIKKKLKINYKYKRHYMNYKKIVDVKRLISQNYVCCICDIILHNKRMHINDVTMLYIDLPFSNYFAVSITYHFSIFCWYNKFIHLFYCLII